MKIGIFGGTFDPPHLGHLILAERCREEGHLDQVWLLPSYRPPHKAEDSITRFEQRCEMVMLATTGHPAFRLETIERDLPTPSYTAATLKALAERHPEHEFSLILGGDSLRDLPGWYMPKEIVRLARLLVVPRPGAAVETASELAQNLGIPADAVRLGVIPCPQVDIASRDIRQRVHDGKSVRYLLPRAVEEYVRERKLYL